MQWKYASFLLPLFHHTTNCFRGLVFCLFVVVVFCWWVPSSLSLWFFIYCSKLLCCGFAVVKRKLMAANTGEQLTILEIWNLCALNTRIQVDFMISLDELTVHLPSGFQRQIMFHFLFCYICFHLLLV